MDRKSFIKRIIALPFLGIAAAKTELLGKETEPIKTPYIDIPKQKEVEIEPPIELIKSKWDDIDTDTYIQTTTTNWNGDYTYLDYRNYSTGSAYFTTSDTHTPTTPTISSTTSLDLNIDSGKLSINGYPIKVMVDNNGNNILVLDK